MYYTNYFEGINLYGLEGSLRTLYYNTELLIGNNDRSRNGFNSSAWESKARITLDNAFDENEQDLNNLRNKISTFISSLSYAKKIQEIQNEMNTGDLDEATLNTKAEEVQTQLNSFNEEINMMSLEEGFELSNGVIDDYSVFQVSISRLVSSQNTFSLYTESLSSDYVTFSGLESSISSDNYLSYAWNIIEQIYDKLQSRSDSMTSWINGYIDTLKTTENNLPGEVASFAIGSLSSTLVKQTPIKPELEEYSSSGKISKITSTPNTGSYNQGGSSNTPSKSSNNTTYDSSDGTGKSKEGKWMTSTKRAELKKEYAEMTSKRQNDEISTEEYAEWYGSYKRRWFYGGYNYHPEEALDLLQEEIDANDKFIEEHPDGKGKFIDSSGKEYDIDVQPGRGPYGSKEVLYEIQENLLKKEEERKSRRDNTGTTKSSSSSKSSVYIGSYSDYKNAKEKGLI